MTAERLLKDGRLTEAIARLENDLVDRPDDLAGRTFLFELLAFAGEFERAGRELDAIERLDRRAEARTGVQAYRLLLEAERTRNQVFREGRAPRFFADPPPVVVRSLEAIELVRAGRTALAREALDQAALLTSNRRGVAGGVAVERLCDVDDLLAPVLELITTGGYYWVPWEEVQLLVIPPPQSLRDLLWAPARLATDDGKIGEVYLPTLYPDTYCHADDAVRLGRLTVWTETSAGIVRGAGQKMFHAGGEPRTFHEIGEIHFAPEAGEGDGDTISGSAAAEL